MGKIPIETAQLGPPALFAGNDSKRKVGMNHL